jgi:hypothetical protein
MIDLAVFLKRNGYKPDQVQDFIPAPFDVATAMYYTGIDPFTKKPVTIAKQLRDRKMQRALMQFFKPENYFEIRRALELTNRRDLIGNGCDCLIPSRPPREAILQRRKEANRLQREAGGSAAPPAAKRELDLAGSRHQSRSRKKMPKPAHPANQDHDYVHSAENQARLKKQAKKESRYEAGPGYRPDRKKILKGRPRGGGPPPHRER